MLGLSQQRLAMAINLTFQQLQKYENAANHVSAGRLYEIARILDVPISFFYDDTDPVRAPAAAELAQPLIDTERDPFQREQTIDLVTAYYAISSEKIRRQLVELAKALSDGDGEPSGDGR